MSRPKRAVTAAASGENLTTSANTIQDIVAPAQPCKICRADDESPVVSTAEIKEAYSNGCSVCGIIYQGLEHYGVESGNQVLVTWIRSGLNVYCWGPTSADLDFYRVEGNPFVSDRSV